MPTAPGCFALLRRLLAPTLLVLLACDPSAPTATAASPPTGDIPTAVDSKTAPSTTPERTSATPDPAPTKELASDRTDKHDIGQDLLDPLVETTQVVAAAANDVLENGGERGTALAQELASRLEAASDTSEQTQQHDPAPAAKPSSKPDKPSAKRDTCTVETFAWANMRVPYGDHGSVRLRRGAWSRDSRNTGCEEASMRGIAFGDVDGDGATEAFLVVGELIAPPDPIEEGCLYGMALSSETLYAYTLDDRCRPKRLAAANTGDCTMEACEQLELRIRGDRVIYGRDRFSFKDGKLAKSK